MREPKRNLQKALGSINNSKLIYRALSSEGYDYRAQNANIEFTNNSLKV